LEFNRKIKFVYLEKKPKEETKLNGTIDENDENSNTSGVLADGNDNSDIKEEITPKRNAVRTAKVKVTKYGEDDEDDEHIMHGMETDDIESDYMGSDSETEKKIKKAISKPRKPKSGYFIDYSSIN